MRRRSEELEGFAGRVAHDLLNPIAAAEMSLAAAERAPTGHEREDGAGGARAAQPGARAPPDRRPARVRAGGRPAGAGRGAAGGRGGRGRRRGAARAARAERGDHHRRRAGAERRRGPLRERRAGEPAVEPAAQRDQAHGRSARGGRCASRVIAARRPRPLRGRGHRAGAAARSCVPQAFDPYVRGAGPPSRAWAWAWRPCAAWSRGTTAATASRRELGDGALFWFELPGGAAGGRRRTTYAPPAARPRAPRPTRPPRRRTEPAALGRRSLAQEERVRELLLVQLERREARVLGGLQHALAGGRAREGGADRRPTARCRCRRRRRSAPAVPGDVELLVAGEHLRPDLRHRVGDQRLARAAPADLLPGGGRPAERAARAGAAQVGSSLPGAGRSALPVEGGFDTSTSPGAAVVDARAQQLERDAAARAERPVGVARLGLEQELGAQERALGVQPVLGVGEAVEPEGVARHRHRLGQRVAALVGDLDASRTAARPAVPIATGLRAGDAAGERDVVALDARVVVGDGDRRRIVGRRTRTSAAAACGAGSAVVARQRARSRSRFSPSQRSTNGDSSVATSCVRTAPCPSVS